MDGPDKIRESEHLDAIFFQLYHLGCPPASSLDPLHANADICGAWSTNKYPQSQDGLKGSKLSFFIIYMLNLLGRTFCNRAFQPVSAQIIHFKKIQTCLNRPCGWDSCSHHSDDRLDAIIGYERGENIIRFARHLHVNLWKHSRQGSNQNGEHTCPF